MRRIDELDGFWVDEAFDRTLHIGFEDEEALYFDLFDSDRAAHVAEGTECLASVLLNLTTGRVKIEWSESDAPTSSAEAG
jgi:hypothetical protein